MTKFFIVGVRQHYRGVNKYVPAELFLLYIIVILYTLHAPVRQPFYLVTIFRARLSKLHAFPPIPLTRKFLKAPQSVSPWIDPTPTNLTRVHLLAGPIFIDGDKAQLIFANGVSKKLSSFSHLLSTLCFPHSLVCIGLLSAPHSSMAMRALLRLPLSSLPTFFTQPLLRVSNVSSVPSLPFRRETILHCHLDAGRATGEELTVERIVEEDEDDPVRRGETCLYSVSSLPLMALAALPGGS